MALKLNPAPTFKAKVGIPVPGQDKPEEIVCIFKHMTRDAFAAFGDPVEAKSRTDVESLMAIMAGWDGVDAEFSADAVAMVVQQYHGAAFAITSAYIAELTKARLGN